MNEHLQDLGAALWAAHWVILVVVVLLTGGFWWERVQIRNHTPTPQAAGVLDPMTPPTPTWWYVDGNRKSYSGATAATRVVTIEVDADTALELANAWDAWHRADVTRDVFRPTWPAECDSLTFEAIQALNARLEPQSPRQFDLDSKPPEDFPVFVYGASEQATPIRRLDVTHAPFPSITNDQENQS